jgi:uncharacterized membrane protein
MWRAAAWLCVIALAVAAHVFDLDILRAACAAAVLLLLAASAPRVLLPPLGVAGACVVVLYLSAGIGRVFDALPALIAALVGWLFARTLLHGRQPLIARAIAALDGPAPLQDPAVRRYARRLTALWAGYQAVLAALAAVWAWTTPAALPPVRVGAAVLLPLAIAALFVGEWALRSHLLPQAPRQALPAFVRGMLRVWPQLLGD